MQLKASLSLLVTAMSLNQAQAAVTANDVFNTITAITALSSNALDLAKNVDLLSLSPWGLSINFRQIGLAAVKIAALGDNATAVRFTTADQTRICDALTSLINTQQELYQTIIDRRTSLAEERFAGSLAAALNVAEEGIDKFSRGVIAVVPTCATNAQAQLTGLNTVIENAVAALPESSLVFPVDFPWDFDYSNWNWHW